MTERLYYEDPALLEFGARIVEAGPADANHYTVLDRSAFYPTSGGQLHDTGSLNGIEIMDVLESDNGEIHHISRQPIGGLGDTVTGLVDRDRRWKNRQMHTAQHILSQVFIRLADAKTVSVHLGEAYAAVELEVTALTEEQLAEAEILANETIRDNLPVEIIFAEGDEIDKLPLRRPPKRGGQIRVIRIGEFDYTACGGTHCRSTAEVGLLKIVSVEKIRARQLVKFLVGRQAQDDYRRRFRATDDLTRILTCHLDDLAPKIEKLLSEHKHQRQEVTRLQKKLLPLRAEELAAMVRKVGDRTIVEQCVVDIEMDLVRSLASQVAEKIRGTVVLHAGDRLIVATAEASGLHAGNLVKGFTEKSGLRGGGSDRVAQVGGVDKDKFDYYAKMFETLISGA